MDYGHFLILGTFFPYNIFVENHTVKKIEKNYNP